MAANYKANPFTLTYDGAIRENVKGQVNLHTVHYPANGIEAAANVYTPANFDPAKRYPAIVVAHPNGGVKEQVAGLYAQKLAEAGYVTIAFDAAYQGASGGKPRYIDKPQFRIEDIRAAADYISQYQGVDAKRLGVLGICGGGGYTIKAAQSDKRFKAVATVSMFNSGDARRNGFMRSQTDTIQERLAQAAAARAQEVAGGEVQYSPAFAAGMSKEKVAALPYEMYREGYEYYAQTHAHPNSQTNYTLSSLQDLMTFDVNTNVDLINQPLLMIAGDKADSLYMSEEVFKNASGTANKELFLVKGASHIQTYWQPEYVKEISAKLKDFFGKKPHNSGRHCSVVSSIRHQCRCGRPPRPDRTQDHEQNFDCLLLPHRHGAQHRPTAGQNDRRRHLRNQAENHLRPRYVGSVGRGESRAGTRHPAAA